MIRPLSEQIVVITGASSGIGRETARTFGERGATVVLAARNQLGLTETAKEVEQAGGHACVVPTDVSDWASVANLAQTAVDRYGRIDTWVNNAGISIYADIEALEPDEMRRVIEVNLLGEMYGCKAAVGHMKNQGQGVIINVSSALARRSVPLQSAYCAAKHGVSGFTEALRLELAESSPGIDVVEVLPSSINTPLFAHARSKIGVMPMPIPPIFEPAVVAKTIVGTAENPQRDVFAGGPGKLFASLQRVSPSAVDFYLRSGQRGFKQQRSNRPDDGRDNLFAPIEEAGSTTGDWGQDSRQTSIYTELLESSQARKVALRVAGAAGVLLLWRASRR